MHRILHLRQKCVCVCFRSDDCFANHKMERKSGKGAFSSICQRMRRCVKEVDGNVCGVLLKREMIKKHKCGFSHCYSCKQYVKMADHQCFMTKPKRSNKDEDIEPIFIVFDLESCQNQPLEKETPLSPQFLHSPNLCIAYKFCSLCMHSVLEKKDFSSCVRCGVNKKVFQGPETMEEFGRWLFRDNQGTEANPVIALAHNAKVRLLLLLPICAFCFCSV